MMKRITHTHITLLSTFLFGASSLALLAFPEKNRTEIVVKKASLPVPIAEKKPNLEAKEKTVYLSVDGMC